MLQRTLEQIQHLKASTSLAFTAGSGFTLVWLGNIDSILKVLLTLVGVISGSYAAAYYRILYKKIKASK